MRYALFFPLCAVIALCAACVDGTIYVAERRLDARGWGAGEVLEYTISVQDTARAYDLDFILRHGDAYPNANLYLYVEVLGPQRSARRDTLHYRLASDAGEWLGDGFGGEWEIILPYAEGVRFTQPGVYAVRARHGMRYDTLAGVRSVVFHAKHRQEDRDGKE